MVKSKSGGCGCTGCDCRTTACTDESFKRPSFFAGQLLTEDDLRSLVDYVVGKNRLHNRYLFGNGVVCGLAVTCHPCGGGKVTVSSGYALDCCGNDILLPCPEEVDFRALLRDLRKRQLAGYDCGDPCEDKDGVRRHYGLYLTYRETPGDPVAPYDSGDPCGQQACEPTRICEGYGFELRCECTLDKQASLFSRIAACIGDFRTAAAAVGKAQAGLVQSQQLDGALAAASVEAPQPFTAEHARVLTEAPEALAPLRKPPVAGQPRPVPPDEGDFRRQVAHYQLLSAAMVRFKSMPEDERKAALNDQPGLREQVAEAAVALEEAGPQIEELAPLVFTEPGPRIEAAESVSLARKYAVGRPPAGGYETVEARMMALGVPYSSAQASRIRTDASLLKEWLLTKLESSTSLTRCDLYERVRRIKVETGIGEGEERDDFANARATSSAARQLARIVIEYIVDCVCLAFNPPCAPCDDTAILLACLEIEDCEVVDICNMSRRFVLSPAALRYWLPVSLIGDLLRKFCCDIDFSKLGVRQEAEVEETRGMVAVGHVEAQPIVRSYAPRIWAAEVEPEAATVLARFKLQPTDIEAATAFSSNFARLSARVADVDTSGIIRRANMLGAMIEARFTPRAEDIAGAPAMRDSVGAVVKEELAATRELLSRETDASVGKLRETVAAESARLGGAISKAASDTDRKLAESLRREFTATKLNESVDKLAVVKGLRRENEKLRNELGKLADAVKKLGGRP